MNSVTGPRLAATLARRGGLGILPQDMPLQDLSDALHWIKAQPVGFDSALTFEAHRTVAEALGQVPAEPGYGVAIVDEHGAHIGAVPAERLRDALPDARLGDFVAPAIPSVDLDEVRDARGAFDLMVSAGIEFAPVLHNGHLVGTVSRRGALRTTLYAPAVDAEGRLSVGAAIGISGDIAAAKARALVEAGADVIVVDTAHGHQEGAIRAVERVAALELGVPIVAGNVVTKAGVRDLVGAGATILKVGVGPGAMCTTRMMTAVGRPQFLRRPRHGGGGEENSVRTSGRTAASGTRATSRSHSPQGRTR